MPFRSHRGSSQVSGTSLCSRMASPMFRQTSAVSCLASMAPGELCAVYLGCSERLQACWLPCASGEMVLLLKWSGKVPGRAGATCFLLLLLLLHHQAQIALHGSSSPSYTPAPPKRLHLADQGAAHVWVLGGLGRHILPQLSFRLASALVYESPALL